MTAKPPVDRNGDWNLDLSCKMVLGKLQLDFKQSTQSRTLGLVGPSGAGKTTTLRVIAGLQRPKQGYAYVRGNCWFDTGSHIWRPPWQREVGWVPQEALLFPHLTVSQHLHYARGKSPHTMEIVRLLELASLLSRRPRFLSGGERQRVALGRALMAGPDLLLLDEPFSALDRDRRTPLMQALRDWCAEHQMGYILVSHDERDIEALTDDVWELRDGKLR